MFLERAGKRLANADSNILQAEEALKEAGMQRVRRQEELEAGQARLETLRTQSTSSFGLHSHPMSGGGSDQGAHITSLQQMVNQLQAERGAFAVRLQEQEGVQQGGRVVDPRNSAQCWQTRSVEVEQARFARSSRG